MRPEGGRGGDVARAAEEEGGVVSAMKTFDAEAAGGVGGGGDERGGWGGAGGFEGADGGADAGGNKVAGTAKRLEILGRLIRIKIGVLKGSKRNGLRGSKGLI